MTLNGRAPSFGKIGSITLPDYPLLPRMPRHAAKHLQAFRVATPPRVIDGDTVDAQLDLGSLGKLSGFEWWRVTIRLWGISAPELDDPETAEKATAAKDRLAQLVGQGPLTAVLLPGTTLGRALGLLLDERDECVNSILVAEGHASPYLPKRP